MPVWEQRIRSIARTGTVPLGFHCLVECRIANVLDAQHTVPHNEVGELLVRGPIVMDGYYGDPQATREVLESAGYNIYPAELERVIAAHPAVAMVAVGSRSDEFKGEVARAYIVKKEGVSVDEDEILSYCRVHLAAYKVPRSVGFVRDLPKTSTGKVRRRLLNTLDS